MQKVKQKDKYMNDILEGKIVITRKHKTEGVSILMDENIVLTQARTIVRDLIFGGTETIIKLGLGDLGYNDLTPISEWSNPPLSNVSDTHIINLLENIPLKTKEVIEVDAKPAIKFTFEMLSPDYNGTGQQKFVELGLSLSDNRLFTKKNRPVFIKDSETEFTIEYYLIF